VKCIKNKINQPTNRNATINNLINHRRNPTINERKSTIDVTLKICNNCDFQFDRYFYMMDLMITSGEPVLLVGEPGSGKTALVQVIIKLGILKRVHFNFRLSLCDVTYNNLSSRGTDCP